MNLEGKKLDILVKLTHQHLFQHNMNQLIRVTPDFYYIVNVARERRHNPQQYILLISNAFHTIYQ